MVSSATKSRSGWWLAGRRLAFPGFTADSLLVFAWLVVAVYGVIAALSAYGVSHFHADDLRLMTEARHEPFLTALLRSHSDLHFSPLHYSLAHGMSWYAPLRFDVALGVMLAFHFATAAVLHRTFSLLVAPSVAALLLIWYGTNVHLGRQLVWWGSATHRLPYVFFSALAVYWYLRYRDTGSSGWAVGVAVAVAAACGFYVKGVFTPVVLVGVELARYRRPDRETAIRVASLFAVLFLLSAAWFVLCQVQIDREVLPPRLKWVRYVERKSWFVLSDGWFGGGLPGATAELWRYAGLIGCGVLIGRTIVANWKASIAWLVGAGVVSLSIAITSVGPRMVTFTGLASISRYSFELSFLVAIFAALAMHYAWPAKPTTRAAGREQVRLGSWGTFAMAVVLAVAVVSTVNSRAGMQGPSNYAAAKLYLDRLAEEVAVLRATEDPPLLVAPGVAPRNVGWYSAPLGLDALLPLLDEEVQVVPRAQARFQVDSSGGITKIVRYPKRKLGSPPAQLR